MESWPLWPRVHLVPTAAGAPDRALLATVGDEHPDEGAAAFLAAFRHSDLAPTAALWCEALLSSARPGFGADCLLELAEKSRAAGAPLDLTLTEFRILAALVRRPGRVATYEELMESAQQGVVSRNTVNTHILHLRKKFKSLDGSFDRIGNEYALGYRWLEE